MDLLYDGEAVLAVPGTPLHVLWRKSMLDPGWQPSGGGADGYGLTMVDFSSEMFGLAAHFLGTEFFVNNTNHFI